MVKNLLHSVSFYTYIKFFLGKHINIKAPKNSGTQYYNYKKVFSIVLLATCNVDCIFTYVNIGGYGSESDGGIFRNSTLGVLLEKKQIPLPDPKPVNGTMLPYYLVGDAEFSLRPYMMTPYSGRDLDAVKSHHNQELLKGRYCIENAFGILSSRWRVFLNAIHVNPENADQIIMSAILLHNFVMMGNRQQYANNAFLMGE